VLQIKFSFHFLLGLVIRRLSIDAAQNPPCKPPQLTKVVLAFAIHESEALGDALSAVIEQHDGSHGKPSTRRTPFFEAIAQVRVEEHKTVSLVLTQKNRGGKLERVDLDEKGQEPCRRNNAPLRENLKWKQYNL
jgi:hypothetical protein